jgi:hypothetical protein
MESQNGLFILSIELLGEVRDWSLLHAWVLSSIKQDKISGGRNLKPTPLYESVGPTLLTKDQQLCFQPTYTTCIIADLEDPVWVSPLCGAEQNHKITSRDPSDEPNIQAITKGRDGTHQHTMQDSMWT